MASRCQRVELEAGGAFASRDVPAWEALAQSIRADSPHAHVLEALAGARGDLARWGVPEDVPDAIERGLRDADWDRAIEAFCRQRGMPLNLYVGPLRAMEGLPMRDGLIVLTKTAGGEAIVRTVEGLADELGRRTFGFPCRVRDRQLELYDLALAAGPFEDQGGKYAAIFAPAYMGRVYEPRRHALMRRSILLHNVFLARFEALTRPVASSHLTIDGGPPAFVGAPADRLEEALALWLVMHEMAHGSGPLPLFGSRVRKLPLGLEYAGVEEMRADMTVWLMLHTLGDLLPDTAAVARDMIAAERLLRSTRVGLAEDPIGGLVGLDSDAENGALWTAALVEGAALRVTPARGWDMDLARAQRVIHGLLAELYDTESAASHDPDRGAQMLVAYAERLRTRLFGPRDPQRFRFPTAARERLAPLDDLPTRVSLAFR